MHLAVKVLVKCNEYIVLASYVVILNNIIILECDIFSHCRLSRPNQIKLHTLLGIGFDKHYDLHRFKLATLRESLVDIGALGGGTD